MPVRQVSIDLAAFFTGFRIQPTSSLIFEAGIRSDRCSQAWVINHLKHKNRKRMKRKPETSKNGEIECFYAPVPRWQEFMQPGLRCRSRTHSI
eukprot:g57357.t1